MELVAERAEAKKQDGGAAFTFSWKIAGVDAKDWRCLSRSRWVIEAHVLLGK